MIICSTVNNTQREYITLCFT